MTMAVNGSAREFWDENFLEGVYATLRETGLDPTLLELELAERVLTKHAESAVSTLQALRRRGVRVAVDNLGKGYSRLSYLRRFPVGALKIDQSFVRKRLYGLSPVKLDKSGYAERVLTDGDDTEGSPPIGREARAATLYSVGSRAGSGP